MLEDRLEQDIKTALLAGDSTKATTLRGLKAVLINEKVAKGKRDSGLSDEEVIISFTKEAKKRQESAELYLKGGSKERSEAELKEKAIIEEYLPPSLSEEEISKLVDETIASEGATDIKFMGQVIAKVKAKAGPTADGGLIARMTKERLQ
jgi:uncharacterized protein YqeY